MPRKSKRKPVGELEITGPTDRDGREDVDVEEKGHHPSVPALPDRVRAAKRNAEELLERIR